MTTSERVPMKDVERLEREREALDREIRERKAEAAAKAEEIAASERERLAEEPDVEALTACLTAACEAYMAGALVWREWLVGFGPLYQRLKESRHYKSDLIMSRHPFAALLGDVFVRARDYEAARSTVQG